MNEETKFSVGDKVSWCGVEGVVVEYNFVPHCKYAVRAEFKDIMAWFTEDGKAHYWHTEPSLKLISKAKKKRKVKLYACLIGESGNQHLSLLTLESLANTAARVPELDKEVEIED